ncbi:unnamed protein product [Boreogadus saida]
MVCVYGEAPSAQRFMYQSRPGASPTGQVHPLQDRWITYRTGGSPTGQVHQLQDRCINYSICLIQPEILLGLLCCKGSRVIHFTFQWLWVDTPILPNFLLKLVEMVLYSSPRFFLAFHPLYQYGFLSDCHAIHQQ